jgi:hypothetical protein
VLIEPLRGFLNAERPRLAITLIVQSEDEVNGLGFEGVDIETFLDFGSAAFGLNNAIAKRRRCPVPEALFGGFAHRACDMLAIFARGVFVEDTDDLPHQLLGGIVTGGLGDGNDLDALFMKLP